MTWTPHIPSPARPRREDTTARCDAERSDVVTGDAVRRKGASVGFVDDRRNSIDVSDRHLHGSRARSRARTIARGVEG